MAKKNARLVQAFSNAMTPEEEWELYKEFAEGVLGHPLTDDDKVKFMARLAAEEEKEKKE